MSIFSRRFYFTAKLKQYTQAFLIALFIIVIIVFYVLTFTAIKWVVLPVKSIEQVAPNDVAICHIQDNVGSLI